MPARVCCEPRRRVRGGHRVLGVNQLLLPLSETVRALRPCRSKVLAVALGFDDAAVVERVALADATVALVRQAATPQPLLLAVDDVMWLVRSTRSS